MPIIRQVPVNRKDDRNAAIVTAREAGLTYVAIAAMFDISPWRANQLYNKYRAGGNRWGTYASTN